MPYFLVVCAVMNHSSICNLLLEFQFDSREECEKHRAAIVEQNPRVSYAACITDFVVEEEFK